MEHNALIIFQFSFKKLHEIISILKLNLNCLNFFAPKEWNVIVFSPHGFPKGGIAVLFHDNSRTAFLIITRQTLEIIPA